MYSPQGANQAIDEFSAAKTERFNLSTTVQKSVQLALQNRGQGAFSCPHLRSQENLFASPYRTGNLSTSPYGARELVTEQENLSMSPFTELGNSSSSPYETGELVHVPITVHWTRTGNSSMSPEAIGNWTLYSDQADSECIIEAYAK